MILKLFISGMVLFINDILLKILERKDLFLTA